MRLPHLFREPQRNALFLGVCLSLPALVFLEATRLAWGERFDLFGVLGRWGFTMAVLLVAQAGRPQHGSGMCSVWHWPTGITIALGCGAAAISLGTHSTVAAWIWLGVWFVLLLQMGHAFSAIASPVLRWALYVVLAFCAGVIPTVIGQLQGRFSDEEFFVAVQAGAVGLFWLLLFLLPYRRVHLHLEHSSRGAGVAIRLRSLVLFLALAGALIGVITLHGYQHSFYTQSAPPYDQITPDAPFLCGETAETTATESSAAVFDRLLAAVAANPRKGPPEYGMLALGTGEERWAQAFRESLLQEAAEQRFSQAAHSVKYIQYDAARRAYYIPLVEQAFPALFTESERRTLATWFGAINRRALTVEWVDWMYATALARWPSGPYENQENGAGLLSLLISTGLEDPDLAEENRAYLRENPRGWGARFRNTDDAFIYQPEWLTNAWFQSMYTGQLADRNRELAFEWLLLQALPDGQAPQYNHPGRPSLAGIAYFAAVELGDPRYLWLAERALEFAAIQGQAVYAQPGAERHGALMGRSPDAGSCLLYGDSGMPTQVGPLAPDKIVFRDGWTADASYLLLNLRFSGWHRYKATNAITVLSRGNPVVSDLLERKTFRWLPAGRSLLRDKRIPREHVSGLIIAERGLRAALYELTGIGSYWAQDPPWYADVVKFEPGDALDWSHTRIADWQGWQHDRYIYFYHDNGPIAVVDRAQGPSYGRAALTWHLRSEPSPAPDERWRITLHAGGDTTDVVFVPLTAEGEAPGHLDFSSQGEHHLGVSYASSTAGNLQVATVFLTGKWLGADVWVTGPMSQPQLWIARDGVQMVTPLYR